MVHSLPYGMYLSMAHLSILQALIQPHASFGWAGTLWARWGERSVCSVAVICPKLVLQQICVVSSMQGRGGRGQSSCANLSASSYRLEKEYCQLLRAKVICTFVGHHRCMPVCTPGRCREAAVVYWVPQSLVLT